MIIKNNEKMKNMLDQFIGKPENFELKTSDVDHYLDSDIPDTKSVLRRTLDLNYKPANAAMSLLLRAGIEKGTDATLELIRESIAKINKC